MVALVRRLSGTRRVGHGGTLDPFASGVLPIFLGKATRVVEFHLGRDEAVPRDGLLRCAPPRPTISKGELTPVGGSGPGSGVPSRRRSRRSRRRSSSGRRPSARSRSAGDGPMRWRAPARRRSCAPRPVTIHDLDARRLGRRPTRPVPIATIDVDVLGRARTSAPSRGTSARPSAAARTSAAWSARRAGRSRSMTPSPVDAVREAAAAGPAGVRGTPAADRRGARRPCRWSGCPAAEREPSSGASSSARRAGCRPGSAEATLRLVDRRRRRWWRSAASRDRGSRRTRCSSTCRGRGRPLPRPAPRAPAPCPDAAPASAAGRRHAGRQRPRRAHRRGRAALRRRRASSTACTAATPTCSTSCAPKPPVGAPAAGGRSRSTRIRTRSCSAAAPPILCDPDERLVRLAAAGVEVTIVQHFDARAAHDARTTSSSR